MTPKPKAGGRPRGAPTEKRTSIVTVRFTREERTRIARQASVEGFAAARPPRTARSRPRRAAPPVRPRPPRRAPDPDLGGNAYDGRAPRNHAPRVDFDHARIRCAEGLPVHRRHLRLRSPRERMLSKPERTLLPTRSPGRPPRHRRRPWCEGRAAARAHRRRRPGLPRGDPRLEAGRVDADPCAGRCARGAPPGGDAEAGPRLPSAPERVLPAVCRYVPGWQALDRSARGVDRDDRLLVGRCEAPDQSC
jgi:hypothetical protein